MNSFSKSLRLAKTLLIPCVAASALLAAEMAGAAALIVRSTGPSAATYKPGKALPDNAKVALKPGDTLTVLATDSTRTFRGPGTFALASAGSGGPAATAAGRRGRFSALRTAGIIPRSPTLWHVDVAQSGKVCITDSDNVMLWRPDATKAAKLTVRNANGTNQAVDWPAGQTVLAWPAGVPIDGGVEYSVAVEGEAEPTKLVFAPLSTVPTDLTSVATALIENHCDTQLDLLIQTVPEAATSQS